MRGGYVLQTGEVGTKHFRSSGRGGIHSTHFFGHLLHAKHSAVFRDMVTEEMTTTPALMGV